MAISVWKWILWLKRKNKLLLHLAHKFAKVRMSSVFRTSSLLSTTLVHVAGLSGRETIVKITGGMRVKADKDEAMLAAQDVTERCKQVGITALHVKLCAMGPGSGAQAALCALPRSEVKIGRIEDVTPIPTDTTRRKGGRRGRRL
uniref:Small ribosomal subunit protein uS11 n=1 Tax=Meloidogyne enterolobii TaxID=390850 RepID=A0A6V7UAE0_MELEN|nr:unnamed protein product [Meloidogyne enterolobii]